jgi:hypothetical protein
MTTGVSDPILGFSTWRVLPTSLLRTPQPRPPLRLRGSVRLASPTAPVLPNTTGQRHRANKPRHLPICSAAPAPLHVSSNASCPTRPRLKRPSSEVTKCDTNTSPRRLVTHLLQQVDQSCTSWRHRGHGSANATRNNTNTNDHTTMAKASKASSKYHTMEALCGGPGYIGTVGCRAATYSTSSGTKSGSSSEKQLVKQG